ncbi:hypothetical protein GC176_20645 [bacterium]|nr:hypothetical protein [bacterium]
MLLGMCAGCGGSSDGPDRFAVSGEVTFEGKPVPMGFIKFTPDSSQGNSGPGTGCPIKDGEYATPKGKGLVGGPHIVEIAGWDGVPITESGERLPEGTELFPLYHTRFDFPKSDGEYNFAVSPDTDIPLETDAASEEPIETLAE